MSKSSSISKVECFKSWLASMRIQRVRRRPQMNNEQVKELRSKYASKYVV